MNDPLCVKLRPSSHSDGYTLIAEYKTAMVALRAQTLLNQLLADMRLHEKDYPSSWSPNDANVSVNRNTLSLKIGYASGVVDAEALIQRTSPETTTVYISDKKQQATSFGLIHKFLQSLTITLTLPKKVNKPIAQLILSEQEQDLAAWLNRVFTLTEETENARMQKRVWKGMGVGIYDAQTQAIDIGNSTTGLVCLENKKAWRVVENEL